MIETHRLNKTTLAIATKALRCSVWLRVMITFVAFSHQGNSLGNAPGGPAFGGATIKSSAPAPNLTETLLSQMVLGQIVSNIDIGLGGDHTKMPSFDTIHGDVTVHSGTAASPTENYTESPTESPTENSTESPTESPTENSTESEMPSMPDETADN